MDDLSIVTTTSAMPEQVRLVTSQLFEAYLACPTKCFLQSVGEVATGNEFTIWNEARRESYRRDGIQRIREDHPHAIDVEESPSGHWKHAHWDMAFNQIVRTQNCEARLDAIQRIHLDGINRPSQFTSIRFVPTNKLSSLDKLTAGFEAFVLTKSLGIKVDTAKIIHGGTRATFKVKTNTLSRVVNKTIGLVANLLSSPSPPKLILNRHCPECCFQNYCRKKAVEKNDLSLLANLGAKEIAQLNRKGIFTVHQLSYTFRPRRRIKRLAAKPEKYHHSLKALAIRESKIYVVGDPQLHIDGTAVYLDVEGLPDDDLFYLIGVHVEFDQGVFHHSLWADKASDEERIWLSLINILNEIDRPVLIHYGSYETTFLKKMYDRYGSPSENSSAAKAITSSINILSLIYAQIYFPTYSNGLKDIAQRLGYEWCNPASSGLQSIVWRHEWEKSGDPMVRETLISYNTDDCKALNLVTRTLGMILQPKSDADVSAAAGPEIIRTENLRKNFTNKFCIFRSPIADLEIINNAAHWDHQRDHVSVRSGIKKNRATKQSRASSIEMKFQIQIVLKPPTTCPKCGKRERVRVRLLSRTVQDLVFGRGSVKGRSVNYVFQIYRCRSCGQEYNVHHWYWHKRKWGWNIQAYFIYHIAGLFIPQHVMVHNINRLYGFNVSFATLFNFKRAASKYYSDTKMKILDRIVHGNLVHVDETQANIKGHQAYVWVLTNHKEVVYVLAESREGEFIHVLLKDFKGVLVSDFYSVYDTINCPQQKCLIHLIRDLNDEILNTPFDEELKSIALGFANLLRPIVESIDLHGLKSYFLRKYQKEVDRFYKYIDSFNFKSDSANKCKQRFVKYRDKLFTFLHYDGVPWHNNNAEHAIKAFARLRDVIAGSSSKSSLEEYLTLLSVAKTCDYRGLNFLEFLRSEETDVEIFAQGHRRRPKSQSDGIA